MMIDIMIFDVKLGQCIFIYPHSNPEYACMIDCGNTENLYPIDFLEKQGFIHNNTIYNLTITNYDQDHFSSLPYIVEEKKIKIKTVGLAKSLTSNEIKSKKTNITKAIEIICNIKDKYNSSVKEWNPPYKKKRYYLEKNELDLNHQTTNNLSQIVFLEYNGNKICVCGDIEEPAWRKLLKKQNIRDNLLNSNIFIASHHGRENGYIPEIFEYCNPDCVIISDDSIKYETQENMSSIYSKHVTNGIILNDDYSKYRKVLTTRQDSNIWIRFNENGSNFYKTFTINI